MREQREHEEGVGWGGAKEGGDGVREVERDRWSERVRETGNSCKPMMSEQLWFLFLTHTWLLSESKSFS